MVSGLVLPWFSCLSMLITQPVYIFFQNCLAHVIYCNLEHSVYKFRLILWELIFYFLPELKFIFNWLFPSPYSSLSLSLSLPPPHLFIPPPLSLSLSLSLFAFFRYSWLKFSRCSYRARIIHYNRYRYLCNFLSLNYNYQCKHEDKYLIIVFPFQQFIFSSIIYSPSVFLRILRSNTQKLVFKHRLWFDTLPQFLKPWAEPIYILVFFFFSFLLPFKIVNTIWIRRKYS